MTDAVDLEGCRESQLAELRGWVFHLEEWLEIPNTWNSLCVRIGEHVVILVSSLWHFFLYLIVVNS